MKMEEWKEYKLSDIVEINPTESLKKGTVAKKIGMDILQPYCRAIPSFSFEPYTGGTKFKNGDTIMARITPCLENGKTAMVNILDDNEIGFGSTEYIVFRAKNNITDPYFIYYLVTSDCIRNPAIKSMVGSSGRQRVQTDVVANLSINLPPLPTQQKIARILSSLDDKIELNNKINTNLEQQAQTLFKNCFVDFEPFGGKMPKEWEEKTLDSFCSIFTGRKNANASVENGKYKFFTCSPNVLPIDSFIFDGDAIIISGNGAYTGRTRFYSGKFDLYQRTYACTMKKDQNQDYIFILYWIIKFVLSKKIMGGTHGSAIPYIVMDDIAKFVINYDKKVFDDLSKIMKSYVLQIQDNENQNEKLAELRDTLLPKLMNGEIEEDKVQL